VTFTIQFRLVFWIGVRGATPPPTYDFMGWCVIKHKAVESFIYAIRFNRWERSNYLVTRCAYVWSCRRLWHPGGTWCLHLSRL